MYVYLFLYPKSSVWTCSNSYREMIQYNKYEACHIIYGDAHYMNT